MFYVPHAVFMVAQVMLFREWLSITARSELGSELDCNVINSRFELGSDSDCYELKDEIQNGRHSFFLISIVIYR